ncbi:hydroxysqualene dehydroxylase HpnE [Limibaculum sp. FT325]|uniref:hydroxysqualene dehydroxylase HpnE n=1 Tax=Thermohalobaculum sediminis TaxID=2939436 RepID=UPI0020C1720A|nr:hydroxysqualene dehydroxylase HpnE [Limibaculum sediminis]MCL5775539.1 hydroxysqualene dehydroxylase HpnE [Limibaculum sediminis]
MPEGVVHVVGAGLAGLSAALRLAAAGRRVAAWEAAGHAGGRCRSFFDARLGRQIDNGNHLVLSGNRSVRDYLSLAGAPGALTPAPEAAFPFADLESGARYTVRLNRGPVPWWIALPSRRVPGTGLRDYLGALALLRAGPESTVAEAVRGRGPLWRGFWEPLTLAAINTTPERASAQLLARVLVETFGKGADASRPMFAPHGLGPALVEPALARLSALGVEVGFNRTLRAIAREGGRATRLAFSDGDEALGPADRVVLALPPSRLKPILPELDLPNDACAILNAHFVVDDPGLATAAPLTGVLGATTQWIFVRGDVVSLTVSAADALGLVEADREALTARLWAETRAALGLRATDHTAARIIIEKRATFDQSPQAVAKRAKARTSLENLFLAGDATDTDLPATIEGAIRSGETAAALAG